MIVSEKNVSDALTYLADDPHPIAKARYELTRAENELSAMYALLFRSAEGGAELRKAYAQSHEDYYKAQDEVREMAFELERHKARVKAAEMLIEVWRSENANVRAAERVR